MVTFRGGEGAGDEAGELLAGVANPFLPAAAALLPVLGPDEDTASAEGLASAAFGLLEAGGLDEA